MIEKIKNMKLCDKLAAAVSACIGVVSVVDIIRYAAQGETVSFVSMLVVNVLIILCALAVLFGRLYPLYFAITAGSFVLFTFTNNWETTLFNFSFMVQAGLSAIGGLVCTILSIVKRVKPKRICAVFIAAMLVIVGAFGIAWGACTATAKKTTKVSSEAWAVPTKYDSIECPQSGTLEKLDYSTKAYATDQRTVQKSAYVYLPYGYDETKQYNILYLMHGTGDNEEYWLKTFSYNKTMVDNLIYYGDIEPLIIVTPTFYVEDDCKGNLDPLTYSFKEELRSDLMVAAESKYSTYAETCDKEGFTASRNHRAFAGLSRGAVTTLHSVFCGSLDYFASFGTFSASRTPVEEFKATIQSDEFKNFSIDYWYLASGAFDFGLHSQISDWNALLEVESRLTKGENTSMNVFPMRYHSMGNWHLALYNFLQKIF